MPISVDGDVHGNSEHRILPYKIPPTIVGRIHTTLGCGLIRACRPMTLLRME